MKERKNLNSIDMFKLLMAVAVVAIHTNPIVSWTHLAAIKVVVIIEEWAVPFFFIASGFLLFHAMKEPYVELKRIDKYIVRIIKMYCAWTFISLPLTLYGYSVSGNGIISCVLSYVKYFLFVGKLYNSYHLWYLLSLIYALVAIRIMIKKNFKPVIITGVSVGIYLLSELMSVLMENPQLVDGVVRQFVSLYQYVFNNGGVFTGMVYVSVGMLIAIYHWHINKWVGAAAVVALNIFKLCLEKTAVHLLMPVEAALVFMTLLDIKLPDFGIWEKCRKTSAVIYLSHLIFFSIYTFLIIRNPNKLGFDSFLVTLILSSLNAVFLLTAQKRGYFKLLRHII